MLQHALDVLAAVPAHKLHGNWDNASSAWVARHRRRRAHAETAQPYLSALRAVWRERGRAEIRRGVSTSCRRRQELNIWRTSGFAAFFTTQPVMSKNRCVPAVVSIII